MSDDGASAYPTQLAVSCGFCGTTDDIRWFCKWCPGSLCNSCKDSHLTILLFKNHTVVPRTNEVVRLYGPSKIAEQCQTHLDKEISTYCNECQVACCVICLVQAHKGHDFASIEDAYLSAEKRLNDNVKELEKDVLPSLESVAGKMKKDRSENRVRIDSVKMEINAFREEMKQVVDESCDDLLEKLDKNGIKLDGLITEIENQIDKIRVLIGEIDRIIQKGDLAMIKYSPPAVSTMIPDVPIPKLLTPIFSPRKDLLTILGKRIGTLAWTDDCSDTKCAPSSSSSKASNICISKINIPKIISFSCEIGVTSITIAGNNKAWIMYNSSDTMYLYDSRGEVVKSIVVKNCKGINDMAITRSEEMIVTCWDKEVRHLSKDGQVLTLINAEPFEPSGVCLIDQERLVVCMRDQNMANHLAVFSLSTGGKICKIRGIDGQGKQHITDPYRVVQNGDDICVVNYRSDIVCVDNRGVVRWVYDDKPNNIGGSFDPCGLSVDKFHNLLIADVYNNSVLTIDSDGSLIHIIQDIEGLVCPWGICVDDETNQVWIGNTSNDVLITRYLS